MTKHGEIFVLGNVPLNVRITLLSPSQHCVGDSLISCQISRKDCFLKLLSGDPRVLWVFRSERPRKPTERQMNHRRILPAVSVRQ